jgi:hypothetical protein
MRLDLRILLPAALTIAAVLIPASPAAAAPSPTPGRCPDGFQPVLIFFATGDRDHNGDGWVCVKGPQGSNGHFNTTDDKDPGTVFDAPSNTWYDGYTGMAFWVTGNVLYDVTSAVDDETP